MNLSAGFLEDVMDGLREQVTILKAERDEAVRERDWIYMQLMNLLARIHRDGGHYVDTHGVKKAIEDAHTLIAKFLVNEAP